MSTTHVHIAAAIRTELARRDMKAPLRILDIGCGNGHLIAFLHAALGASGVEVWGLDVADSGHVSEGFPATTVEFLDGTDDSVDWARRIVCLTVGEPWPFDDEWLDASCSNQVLEHIFDLPQFMGEVGRTLRPGGFSVHVAPLRRVVWEHHLNLPFIHWARSGDTRRGLARALTRAGFGRLSRQFRVDEWDLDDYSTMVNHHQQFGCAYHSWRELATAAKSARLDASHRYTARYYAQKASALRGRDPATTYGSRDEWIAESLAFATLPFVSNATVVLEKPHHYDIGSAHPSA